MYMSPGIVQWFLHPAPNSIGLQSLHPLGTGFDKKSFPDKSVETDSSALGIDWIMTLPSQRSWILNLRRCFMRRFPTLVTMIWAILGGVFTMVQADEGMWLFNQPPTELLKAKYGVELSKDWLGHLQNASIRFNNGGSGSFISSKGLVLTNHHIGADALEKLSTKDRNLLKAGFLARNPAAEMVCPDLELNVLVSIEDVTQRVESAVKPNRAAVEAAAARRAILAEIEAESKKATGLRSDVVTLHHGGLYHLYRYHRFTDVRLVFAPEAAIAGYGGDVDNFEFPRYDLDFCLFRVYVEGKPHTPEHFLKVAPLGAASGELVFVSGHPGATQRLETLAKLRYRRDCLIPYSLARLRTMEAALLQYSATGPEPAARSATLLHSYANARKALSGQLQGLLNAELLATKAQQEANLVAHAKIQTPWQQAAQAVEAFRSFDRSYFLLELAHGTDSELFTIARHVVRLATEKGKPNGTRLREYRDSNRESLELSLFSPAPIHKGLETIRLGTALSFLAEQLGGEHPVVGMALDGESPMVRAAGLVEKTRLAEVSFRKTLAGQSAESLAASDDPMIRLALALDKTTRENRIRYEAEVEEPERQANGAISRLRFQLAGANPVAPDATFTLRLAFGTVKGYEAEGKTLSPWTTMAGLWDRHALLGTREPFLLPQRWLDGKANIPLETPFNIVSTADTIGGNSGSPVVNRKGELIGVNFDRNRFGLVRNFVYTDLQARHIMVDIRIILATLQSLYGAEFLVKELGN